MKIKQGPVAAAVALEALESRAHFAAGALDPSFGQLGRSEHVIEAPDSDRATAIAVQADGKVLAAGNSRLPFVLRYNPNGSLDPTFGNAGRVRIPGSVPNGQLNAVAVQPDGRIVLAGTQNGEFLAYRLNPDGSFDTSFGTGGFYRSGAGKNVRGQVSSVVILPTGEIVLGGHATGRRSDTAALVWLNADGTAVPSFGSSGVLLYDVTPGADQIRAMTVLPDGSIVATGVASQDELLMKITPTGRFDRAFGKLGVAVTHLGNRTDVGEAIAVTPDGAIIVAATAGNDFVLARHRPDGTLDKSFGAGGLVRLEAGPVDRARAVRVTPDGKLVLVGHTTAANGAQRILAAQFTSRGTFDRTYGVRGKAVFDFDFGHGAGAAAAEAAAPAPNGGLYVLGTALDKNDGDVALVRLGAAGMFDTTFGGPDTITGFSSPQHVQTSTATRQADGKTLVLSRPYAPGHGSRVNVTRFNPDGTVDRTYANGGTAFLDLGASWDEGDAFTVDARGRAVIITFDDPWYGAPALHVARLRADGTPDTTFAPNGTLKVDATGHADRGSTIAAVAQGDKVVVAIGGRRGEIRVVRLTDTGAADPAFGTGGWGTITVKAARPKYSATAAVKRLLLAPDGAVVAVGTADEHRNSPGLPSPGVGTIEFAVARFTTDGNVDTAFGGGDGVATANLGGTANVNAATFLPDGRLAVVGYAYLPWHEGDRSHTAMAVALFRADGAPDESFGINGTTTVRSGIAWSDIATSVVVQSDGKLVLAGTGETSDANNFTTYQRSLARLTPDGRPDPTFGDDGWVRLPTSGGLPPSPTLVPAGEGVLLVTTDGPGIVMTRHLGDDEPGLAASVAGGVLRVTGTPAADSIVFRRRGNVVELLGFPTLFDPATFSRVEVAGLAGNDRIDLSPLTAPALVDGAAGNDVVLGGSGDDSLLGGAGHDTIFGGNGHDTLRGGNDNDYLNGGRHTDQVFGDAGNDQVFAADANVETIDGGGGFDRAKGDPDDLLASIDGVLA